MTNKLSDRKCSFCQNIGHTTTSCLVRKSQLKKAEALNAEARKEMFQIMDKMGLYIGALVEMKYKDFSNLASLSEPEIGSEIGLFYVKEIRWIAMNKTMLDNDISRKLKEYLQTHAALRSNYSNIILVNADYPNGFTMTVTLDRLKYMASQEKPFSLENNVVGDFFVHDPGSKEASCNTIPKDFFSGKFYNTHKKIIK
jgi:hypothetical protein